MISMAWANNLGIGGTRWDTAFENRDTQLVRPCPGNALKVSHRLRAMSLDNLHVSY